MSEEKRYTPSVSLKEDERDWLKKQAEKAGVSYTRYLKQVALGRLPQAEKTFYKDQHKIKLSDGITVEEFTRTLYEQLPSANSNLNQISRRANESGQVGIKMVEEIKDLKKEMSKITDVFLKVMP